MGFNTKSEFQRIQVIETAAFGKTLVLDYHTQSSARDEFAYHECLVHPPLLAVGWSLGGAADKPAKRAFIGGGGELATAREILKHESIEEVVMVDLDKVVVDVSREQLPTWGAGCFENPKLKVEYTDAHAWMCRDDEATGTFDLIVMDICDPIEAGPGICLYTKEFYEVAKTKLRPGGVFVTQGGPAGLLNHKECWTVIAATLSSVFEHVVPYCTEVPSFGSNWGYVMAFDSTGVPGAREDPAGAKAAFTGEATNNKTLGGHGVKSILHSKTLPCPYSKKNLPIYWA